MFDADVVPTVTSDSDVAPAAFSTALSKLAGQAPSEIRTTSVGVLFRDTAPKAAAAARTAPTMSEGASVAGADSIARSPSWELLIGPDATAGGAVVTTSIVAPSDA
jgi:hypothetical protein